MVDREWMMEIIVDTKWKMEIILGGLCRLLVIGIHSSIAYSTTSKVVIVLTFWKVLPFTKLDKPPLSPEFEDLIRGCC